jgi:hypothetical protein
MKRALVWSLISVGAVIAAWQSASAVENSTAPVPAPKPTVAQKAIAPAAPKTAAKPKPVVLGSKMTPMADRIAVVGLLNKRNGLYRDISMKPGQAVHIGDVVIRMKACETTAPWEQEQLTGSFVQLIVRGADTKWRKVFSGWLYKESPSLNVVEHPIYDVWTKSCAMKYPDVGPETTVVRGGGDDDSAYTEK